MQVKLKHFGGMNFEAVADSGHRVTISAAAEAGGGDTGPRPMEMVLMGLGACSGIDVLGILKKARQPVTGCEILLDAARAESIPKVFSRIHVHYIVSGANLDRNKVARAISLSMQKYCSVTRMLEKSAAITHGFEIAAAPAESQA